MKRFVQDYYDVHHIGSFGRFFSGSSFPVDYLQASFTAADLMDLTFAQDLHPDGQDFELLMQRDIDKERVFKQVVPYINPSDLTDQESKHRAIFFPPLLVAIVPVKNKSMESYYPSETISTDQDVLYREWPGQIKLELHLDNGVGSYSLELLDEGVLKTYGVDKSPVRLSIRKPKGAEQGAALVVIDGQHRLAALRHVYKMSPDVLKGVCVPVCIIFPPNSTPAYQKYMNGADILAVHSVFRSLFVDVNTMMQQVGGHFAILLRDSSLSAVVCRKFCDFVLKNYGERGLAQIEWNIKSKKDSTVLTRKYSLTSIGVLEKSFSKYFSGPKKASLLNFVLALPEIEAHLHPHDGDGDAQDIQPVEWERFSLHQRRYLDEQVEKHFVPCLVEIFFGVDGFKSLRKAFDSALEELESERDKSPAPEYYSIALQQILEYKPIDDEKEFRRASDIYRAFEHSFEAKFKDHVEGLLQYAIVQRGILDAWCTLLEKLKDLPIGPLDITRSFVSLLNSALRNDGELFSPQRLYMQYTVWETVNIKPAEETRVAISNCILTLLATDGAAKEFVSRFDLKEDLGKRTTDSLYNLGVSRAGEFINQYHNIRQKYFVKTYPVEFALLSDDDRSTLSELEEKYQRELQEVRDKARKQEDVSNEFMQEVEKYVGRDVKRAIGDFRSAFGYSGGIAIEQKFSDLELE